MDGNQNHPATIRKASEGRRIGIVGDVYRFLATGEDTDGKYATFEATVPPGASSENKPTCSTLKGVRTRRLFSLESL